MPRDSRRRRLYDMEYALQVLFSPLSQKMITSGQVCCIMLDAWQKMFPNKETSVPIPSIRFRRMQNMLGNYRHGIAHSVNGIPIPSEHIVTINSERGTMKTVLHETVHAAIGASMVAWHGPEFVRLALDLYCSFMKDKGIDPETFMFESEVLASKHGVKIARSNEVYNGLPVKVFSSTEMPKIIMLHIAPPIDIALFDTSRSV